ncbi:hypothetical protein [Paenibacillus apiarius]|uniref:Uncharacterized protein n=1 Tax=Paenibacillus apiarius TaxID=46240 RepID=A0ABT4DX84_9BACL|nr:hypothetical protein [Paenibacillus apiarius]MCY9513271.1 hypothetical protein [Paenibacillus apiarius]MCY9521370.1 hypothetical protein [Paenibacillus apiarius]MCY9554484.1 hypothetical protein [Paenibacillus apiarius]MCY9560687.1 hypothetical protein [Paenibacillus apiarius]MCY9685062.1 hypothetical protein [Paenibacillus apiarius]
MSEKIELRESKLVHGRVDLKAATIDTLQTTFNILNKGTIEGIKSSDTLELVFLTNFGYVTGEIIDIAEASDESKAKDDFKKYLFASTIKHRNSAIAGFEEENENLRLTSDSSLVYLKNAIVKPFSNPESSFKFGDLMLFTDQIVGISGKGRME